MFEIGRFQAPARPIFQSMLGQQFQRQTVELMEINYERRAVVTGFLRRIEQM